MRIHNLALFTSMWNCIFSSATLVVLMHDVTMPASMVNYPIWMINASNLHQITLVSYSHSFAKPSTCVQVLRPQHRTLTCLELTRSWRWFCAARRILIAGQDQTSYVAPLPSSLPLPIFPLPPFVSHPATAAFQVPGAKCARMHVAMQHT